MPSNVEQRDPVGITESCKYNDHSQCNGAGGRCGCDCHRPKAAEQPVPAAIADLSLPKACPNCNIKRPAFERYCRMCGSKLGTVQCPGCQSIYDPEDKYCYNCGMPTKVAGDNNASHSVLSVNPSVHPATAVRSMVPEPIEAAQAETNVLRALQEAHAAAGQQKVEEVTSERTFSLPNGTFKVTSKAPRAGQTHGAVPFRAK